MSFLQQIQAKRSKLNATKTIVTKSNGERYLECHLDKTNPIKLESSCLGFVVDTKPDKVPAEILESFIYLGSQDAVCAENVQLYKLTHILSVGINMDISQIGINCKHAYLPLLDLPETEIFKDKIFERACGFLDEANESKGCVLVHCNAGVSRSASIVIAYLMQRQGLSFMDAYNVVKLKRPCIQPNVGFLQQLQNFQSDKIVH